MDDPSYAPNEEIPGTQYRFVEVLGAGGHGVVWRVEHTFLDTPAVMKVIHAELSTDEDHVRRAIAEAKLLAKLEHQNLVAATNGGMTAERQRRAYFVMPYLRGMTLHKVMSQVRDGLGLKEAVEIAIGVLDGLDCAHAEHKVIHRDIKPANVFLNQTASGQTVPKILDWGIAHFRRAPLHFTGEKFIGTPRYAAPEQLRGDAPTARTDLYAVGLVLYEMLAGRHPFHDRRELGALVQAQLFESPPALGRDDGFPSRLTSVVQSMLEKAPERRPSSAAAAAAALRRVLRESALDRADVPDRPREHLTEPSPMRNLMITTSAGPASSERIALEPRKSRVERTVPLHDTVPGAPPFAGIEADGPLGVGNVALDPTEPSPRAPPVLPAPARGVDRLALTREARASATDRPGPKHGTVPMAPGEMASDVLGVVEPTDASVDASPPAISPPTRSRAARRHPSRAQRLVRDPVAMALGAGLVTAACLIVVWAARSAPDVHSEDPEPEPELAELSASSTRAGEPLARDSAEAASTSSSSGLETSASAGVVQEPSLADASSTVAQGEGPASASAVALADAGQLRVSRSSTASSSSRPSPSRRIGPGGAVEIGFDGQPIVSAH